MSQLFGILLIYVLVFGNSFAGNSYLTYQNPEALLKAVEKSHFDSVVSVVFSPNGKLLVSGSYDGTIKFWDVDSGKEIFTVIAQVNGASMAFSPDGSQLAYAEGNEIKLLDIASHKVAVTLKGHSEIIYSISFSSDGKYLVSGGGSQIIKLWELATGNAIRSFTGPTKEGYTYSVYSVAISSDGDLIASGSEDGIIKLWDINSGLVVNTLKGHFDYPVHTIVFSSDGKYLASGSLDSTILLWDVNKGTEIKRLRGHSYAVNSLAFSTDGKLLFSGSADSSIKLWDIVTGEEITTLKGHLDEVRSIALSPDGNHLASGANGGDGTVKLWDIASEQGLILVPKNKNEIQEKWKIGHNSDANSKWEQTIVRDVEPVSQ